MNHQDKMAITEDFETFLRRYYEEDVKELAGEYPSEKSLYIDWTDIYRFDSDIADDLIDKPDEFIECIEDAVRTFDLPIDVTLCDANIRITGLNDGETLRVGDIRAEHAGMYVGISGDINRVSETKPKITKAAFECQRCGCFTIVPQLSGDFEEPHECEERNGGCGRKGPFRINFGESEFVDSCMVQLKQPPGEATRGNGSSITGRIEGELVEYGGDDGLQGRAGESATVYGILRLEQSTTSRGKAQSTFDPYLEVKAVDFDTEGEDDIDVKEHLPTIREEAQKENILERFARSLATQLPFEGDWKKIKLAGVAYLMGSFRVNPEGSALYRGDTHMLLMGDPGTGKTTFLDDISTVSPKCERRSATGLSSSVGLTAAAVHDEFDDGGWALEPGVLVRANGGHCILSELDKGPDELNKIHDALEREQRITVDKADIHAELNTRTGLLADANPVDGRFDVTRPPAEQLGIDPALISRMDLIIPMVDVQRVEKDKSMAGHWLDSYSEASELERAERTGEELGVEPDVTAREIELDVMRAWVKHARENIFPLLTGEAKRKLGEFYVDTRDDTSSGDSGSITIRTLEAGVRLATAFARVELSDTVEPRHAEKAIDLSNWAIGKTFDSDTGEFKTDYLTETQGGSQDSRVRNLKKLIADMEEGTKDGADREEVIERAVNELNISPSKAEHDLDKLSQKGDVYKPSTDTLRTS